MRCRAKLTTCGDREEKKNPKVSSAENLKEVETHEGSEARTDLIRELVLLLVVKRQLFVKDVVQILLHESHCVRKTVLLVVSAVIHVGIVTKNVKTNTLENGMLYYLR